MNHEGHHEYIKKKKKIMGKANHNKNIEHKIRA